MQLIRSTNLITIFTLSFLAILLNSCSNNSSTEDSIDLNDSSMLATKIIKINNKTYSVPSPIQFASVIKNGGSIYNPEILNPTMNTAQYSNITSKALNLGVYGADLSYSIIYNQTQDAFEYLNAIRKVSASLDLSGVFNNSLIVRFKDNIGNIDSLYNIVGSVYLSGDTYLKDNDRADVSGLILVGGWIESVYLATITYKTAPNEMVKNRIGEQKLVLENIVNSLKQMDEKQSLINELEDLLTVYDSVVYTYEFIEPTTDNDKKLTTINSKTNVEISEEQIQSISQKINLIRNEIIGRE